jgi:hypothetical protein
LKKSLRTGPEQQTIDDLFVLQSQGCHSCPETDMEPGGMGNQNLGCPGKRN